MISPNYNPERPVASDSQVMKLAKFMAYAPDPKLTNMHAIKLLNASSACRRLRELRERLAGWNINLRGEMVKLASGKRCKVYYLTSAAQRKLQKRVGK
jgi:hypothetical protein